MSTKMSIYRSVLGSTWFRSARLSVNARYRREATLHKTTTTKPTTINAVMSNARSLSLSVDIDGLVELIITGSSRDVHCNNNNNSCIATTSLKNKSWQTVEINTSI